MRKIGACTSNGLCGDVSNCTLSRQYTPSASAGVCVLPRFGCCLDFARAERQGVVCSSRWLPVKAQMSHLARETNVTQSKSKAIRFSRVNILFRANKNSLKTRWKIFWNCWDMAVWGQLTSSQALPALKVAIDNECSGKGLVFAKNNQPDFGLLFLAHFAHFSIRTETEATVHTHSQTNRHLRLFPAAKTAWHFGTECTTLNCMIVVYRARSSWRVWSLKSMLSFTLHTLAIVDDDRHAWHVPNFESKKAFAFCTLNFYDVQYTPGKLR